jgi:hypothetical protein
MQEEKEALIERMQEIIGYVPVGTRDLLNVLIHPDLIEFTKAYVKSRDEASRCQKYKEPWSCAKEAEARYENIKYGWLGSGSGVGYAEWWCENCKKRVMEG